MLDDVLGSSFIKYSFSHNLNCKIIGMYFNLKIYLDKEKTKHKKWNILMLCFLVKVDFICYYIDK